MRTRYPTDLTDEQWAVLQPLICSRPPSLAAGRGKSICGRS